MAVRSELWIKKVLADRYRASFSMRFLSFCYDMLGLFLLWLLIGTVTMISHFVSSVGSIHFEYYYLPTNNPLVFSVVAVVYIFLIPLLSSERQTVGMMLIGLKFVDENADKLSRIMFLKRECLKWVLFPGFILTLTRDKQSLADILSNTYVTSHL